MKILTIADDTAIVVEKITCVEIKDRVITIVYLGGRLIATYESAEDAKIEYKKMLEFIKEC